MPLSANERRESALHDAGARQGASSDIPNDGPPVKRRRRTRLACQACRDRKIRCDGGTPVCNTCLRKKIDLSLCVYPATDGNLSLSRNVHQVNRTDSGVESAITTAPDPSIVAFAPNHVAFMPSPGRVELSTPSATESQRGNRAREEASRALNETSSWAPDPHEDISPSVGAITSSVDFEENAYDRGLPNVYDTRAIINPARSTRLPTNIGQFLADLSLPPKPLMDHLFEIFWSDIHPQSPLFHQQTFMKRYEKFWLDGLMSHQPSTGSSLKGGISASDKIFFAIINLILALVQQRTPPEQRRNNPTTEEVFYNRADRLLSPDSLEVETVELVQALVLKAAYLREADMTNFSWIAAGTAIRAAQAAGLYVQYTRGSQAEREERNRLWYSCVLMDRVQSMTYGRPTMISESFGVPYPTLIDDEYMSTDPTEPDAVQPDGVPSRMAYFVSTVKLSDIRSRIRQSINPRECPDDVSHAKQYGAIIEFDAEIGRWYGEVPVYLRSPSFDPKDSRHSWLSRQSNYLRCQYLHLRITLCRQLIIDFARYRASRPHTPLQEVFCQGCVETCIQAARDLINTIEPNIGTNLLPPGWYITSYYLYTAGTTMAIILLTSALQDLCKQASLEELQQAWTQCLNCFAKYHRLGIRFARNCIIGLKKMFAEDHGAILMRTRSDQQIFSSSLRSDQQIQDNPVGLATNMTGNYTTSDPHNGPHEEVTAEPWWMNENFHWLNTFDESDDYGSTTELNSELWRFMEQVN